MVRHNKGKWIVSIEGYKEMHLTDFEDPETYYWEIIKKKKIFAARTKGEVAKMIAEELVYISGIQLLGQGDFCWVTEDKIKLYDSLEDLVEFPTN